MLEELAVIADRRELKSAFEDGPRSWTPRSKARRSAFHQLGLELASAGISLDDSTMCRDAEHVGAMLGCIVDACAKLVGGPLRGSSETGR